MLPTGRQLRMARAALGLGYGEMAQSCNLPISDVLLAEDGRSTDDVRIALRCALESCGIEFGANGWVRYRSDATQPEPAATTVRHGAAGNTDIKPGRTLARAIGAACKRARKAQGLTQEQASEKLGISIQHYARIERGASAPSISTLFVIVQVFGLDLDALLNDKPAAMMPASPQEVTPCQEFSSPAFGTLCRRTRDARNLTQEDLSARIGVSPEYYARIERGEVAPSLATLWRLVRSLELDINALLPGRDSPALELEREQQEKR